MRIKFLVVGKTSVGYLREGCRVYTERIKRYLPFEEQVLADLKGAKKLSPAQVKQKQGEQILKALEGEQIVVLLDEKGKQFGSEAFARRLEKWAVSGTKSVCFVVGGAYGFSQAVFQSATLKISLSPMTFSHQLVRLIFLEQLYRAFTIVRGEPYHNA